MHLAFTQEKNDIWLYESSILVFHGNMTLKGNLTMYWDNDKDLNLLFVPFNSSRRDLPYINDVLHEDEMDIDIALNAVYLDKPRYYNEDTGEMISTHQPLPDNVDLIKKAFPRLPKWFWQERTGAISRPAQITINAFGIQTVCDTRFYYATAISIEPLNNHRQEPSEETC